MANPLGCTLNPDILLVQIGNVEFGTEKRKNSNENRKEKLVRKFAVTVIDDNNSPTTEHVYEYELTNEAKQNAERYYKYTHTLTGTWDLSAFGLLCSVFRIAIVFI